MLESVPLGNRNSILEQKIILHSSIVVRDIIAHYSCDLLALYSWQRFLYISSISSIFLSPLQLSETSDRYTSINYVDLISHNNYILLRHYVLISLLLCQNSSCCFRSSCKQYFKLQKWHFSPGFGGGLFLTLMAGLIGWYELTSISSSRIELFLYRRFGVE